MRKNLGTHKEWTDKENVCVCVCVSVSEWSIIQPQKEGNPAICDNMSESSGIILSEINQREKDNISSCLCGV